MINTRSPFPKTQQDMNRLGRDLKQRALSMTEKMAKQDESEADNAMYQPGRVSTQHSFQSGGDWHSIRESLTFDPETKAIDKYDYLENVKTKNDDGETIRQQHSVRVDSRNGWVIGSEGQTEMVMQISESWYEEGLTFDGSETRMHAMRIHEEGQPHLYVERDLRGSYGSGEQVSEGFIVTQ